MQGLADFLHLGGGCKNKTSLNGWLSFAAYEVGSKKHDKPLPYGVEGAVLAPLQIFNIK